MEGPILVGCRDKITTQKCFLNHEVPFGIQTLADSDQTKPVLEILTVCLDSLQY